MKELEKEIEMLVPPKSTKKESSPLSYIPVIYLIISATTLLSTLAASCLTNQKECFVYLGQLPVKKPYIFQAGMCLAVSFGIGTVLAYHTLLYYKLKERLQENRNLLVVSSCVFGVVSQVSLGMFAVSGSEKGDVSKKTLELQEDISLVVFLTSSLVHACSSLGMFVECRQRDVFLLKQDWMKAKGLLLGVMVLVSFVHSSILIYSDERLGNFLAPLAYKILSYSLFLCHLVYMGTFYFDLKEVSCRFEFHSTEKYMHLGAL